MRAAKQREPTRGLDRQRVHKLVMLLFWLMLLSGYMLYTLSAGFNPLAGVRTLVRLLTENIYGPVFFVLAYTVRPLLLFPAALLSVAAGLVFGPVWGVIYTLLGSNISATLAFALGAFLGKGVLYENTSGLERYVRAMRHNTFEAVLIMRLLFLPFDLVNYLAGFLRVHYGAFLMATVLGSLPGKLAFVLFGASTEGTLEGVPELRPWVLILSVVIFLASLIFARFIKRREQAPLGG